MFSPPIFISSGDEYDKRPALPADPNARAKPFVVSSRRHPHLLDSALGRYTAQSAGEPYAGSMAATEAERRQAAADQQPFRPAGVSHKSSGKGDYYGTFAEKNPPKHEHEFPPINRPRGGEDTAKMHTRRLIYTNPAKKGTYGFHGLTIQKRGEIIYVAEPYEGTRRKEALERKEANARFMGAPFRAAVPSGGCFDETEHGFPKVYSLTKPLPPKKRRGDAPPPVMSAKPWIPGGALVKEITDYPEYVEDPLDERERKVQEMRRNERRYKAWHPAGNYPWRHIHTKPIQYNPPPVI